MRDAVRLLRPTDAAVLAELVAESRSFLAPWEPIRGDAYFTVAGQSAEIERALDAHEVGHSVPFAILDESGDVVGRITINSIVGGAFQSASIGYWVAERAGGRGYATDAVEAVVRHAFDELVLHRLEAGTLVHNLRSQRVLTKAGFERYGLAPRYVRINGEWQDHILFQRLNPAAE